MAEERAPKGRLWREQTDGRVARGDRTRRAIVEAHTDLLRAGDLRPTARRIADQAGVSVRTLWSSFGDMEVLLSATVDFWLESDEELKLAIDLDQPLTVRIEQFCEERARRLENISPAARASVVGEPFSATLQRTRQFHVARARDDVARVFAAEIAADDDPEALTDALTVATSWWAWALVRDDLGRSVDDAIALMHRALTDLLAGGD